MPAAWHAAVWFAPQVPPVALVAAVVAAVVAPAAVVAVVPAPALDVHTILAPEFARPLGPELK